VIVSVILDRLLHHFDHGQYQRLKLPIQGKAQGPACSGPNSNPITACEFEVPYEGAKGASSRTSTTPTKFNRVSNDLFETCKS
jgi:hypothetical protein